MSIGDWDEKDCENDDSTAMSYREFIDKEWGPLNDRIVSAVRTSANELGLSIRRRFGLDNEKREIEITNCISAIVKSLQDRNVEFRRAAVILLEAALLSVPATVRSLNFFPEELGPVIGALATALADESVDVREIALRALGNALSEVGVDIVKAIAQDALKDPYLSKSAVGTLMAVNVDIASAAIPELTELLEREQDEAVLTLACQALARFKIEAHRALSVLIGVAFQEAKPKLQREALRTIVEIDPMGELLAQQITDQSARERFLDLLREPQIKGRILRQRLQVIWRNRNDSVGEACAKISHGEFNGAASQETPSTKRMLSGYRDMLIALGLKNNEKDTRRLQSLNKRFDGPIVIGSQGRLPMVDQSKLLAWWNDLEKKVEESNRRRRDRKETVKNDYNYGRAGTVIPDIGGSVKIRRKSPRK